MRALGAIARAADPQESKPVASAVAKGQASAKSHLATPEPTIDNNALSASRPSELCSLCGSAHYIAACPDYRGKIIEQRHEFVQQKNLCVNCLGPHQVRNCQSANRCRTCGNPHRTTLHRSGSAVSAQTFVAPTTQAPTSLSHLPVTVVPGSRTTAPAPPFQDLSKSTTSLATHVALTTSIKCMPVLLATALVKETSCYGEQYEVRVLLDQGSEVSFITKSLAQRINLPRRRVSLPINGIGGHRFTLSRGLVSLNIVSCFDPAVSLSINTYVLAKLTSYLPPIQVVQNPWLHLQVLELADPDFSSATQIDMILGAEVYSAILQEGLRRGGPGSRIAQRTALGRILSGSVLAESNSADSSRPAQGLQCSIDHELLELVQRFCIQEEPITAIKTTLSEEESQCERHFSETHSRTPEGRYIHRAHSTQPNPGRIWRLLQASVLGSLAPREAVHDESVSQTCVLQIHDGVRNSRTHDTRHRFKFASLSHLLSPAPRRRP